MGGLSFCAIELSAWFQGTSTYSWCLDPPRPVRDQICYPCCLRGWWWKWGYIIIFSLSSTCAQYVYIHTLIPYWNIHRWGFDSVGGVGPSWELWKRERAAAVAVCYTCHNKTSTPLLFLDTAAIRALPRYLTHCTFIPHSFFFYSSLFTHVGGMLGIMQIIPLPSIPSYTPLPAAGVCH